jgi:hypothetical protein
MGKETRNNDWLTNVLNEKKQYYSELDVLLRGLDRSFNPDNLPAGDKNYSSRNFYYELIAIRDVILRVLSILEMILPESKKNAFWFQKYAEHSLPTDRKRDIFREKLYAQDTPEQSFFFLYNSFINLKVLIYDLLISDRISYSAYKNFGELFSREIRENRFFDPFKKEIHPEFDTINNSRIAMIVKSIKDSSVRRLISGIFIYLFRFTRYLECMEITSHLPGSLNCAFVVLVLLRSETRNFLSHLNQTVASREARELTELIESISFQFSIEAKRIYDQEIRDILITASESKLRGRIENSHGILLSLTEECILQIARHFSPQLSGNDIFPSFETRLEQSLKLRDDVSVLHRFFKILEEDFGDREKRMKIFASLTSYMLYFESFSFRLLRYEDYNEFSRFFRDFFHIAPESLSGDDANDIIQDCNRFRIFLETILNLISQRSELLNKVSDEIQIEATVQKFLSEHVHPDTPHAADGLHG